MSNLALLQRKVEILKRNRDMAEGALRAAKSALSELGYDTIEAAEAALEALDAKEARLEAKLTNAIEAMESRFNLPAGSDSDIPF